MAQKYPEHIQKNVDRDKNYYSLYNMENIERCKADPDYLGEAMLANAGISQNKFEVINNYIKVSTRNGEYFYIDVEDYLLVSSFNVIGG